MCDYKNKTKNAADKLTKKPEGEKLRVTMYLWMDCVTMYLKKLHSKQFCTNISFLS